MRLVVKGSLESIDQLPKGSLPAGAKQIDEPDTLQGIAAASVRWFAVACCWIMVIGFIGFACGRTVNVLSWAALAGLVMSVLLIPLHEFIHYLCVPRGNKDATAEMWWSLNNGMFMIATTEPMSKVRFIVLSLMPNLILGWAPLIAWVLVPMSTDLASYLFVFAAFMAVNGCGDYLNIANVARQVPAGAKVQMSGIHTYWFE